MTTTQELKGILLALKEDIDDTLAWQALADWGEEQGKWSGGERKSCHLKAWLLRKSCMLSAVTTQGANACSYVEFHYEYAEPGYDDGSLITTGNWNKITKYENGENKTLDDTPELLGNLLEQLGFSLEWSDEWTTCSDCGALVRTEPDSYSWRPSYVMGEGEGEILCLKCHTHNT